MPIYLFIRRISLVIFKHMSLTALIAVLVGHFAITYATMLIFNEDLATGGFLPFLYWYVTTTSTVGYGDISPQSEWGRIFTAFWVMLGGIALLSTFIGAAATSAVNFWRKRMNGSSDYGRLSGHTVVIGWFGEQSQKMIELLLCEQEVDSRDKIVLVDDSLEINPMPGSIIYVKGESLTSPALLKRAGIPGCARILITGKSDEQTLTIALAANSIKSDAHMVAHFSSSQSALLAKQYIPNLEIASSMTMEMLVRSARDPGTSGVIYDLLRIDEGVTLFAEKINQAKGYLALSHRIQGLHQATLIGFRREQNLRISPGDVELLPSDEVYYIADKRLPKEAFQ